MAKVAVLAGQEFQDEELRIPVDRLRAAGHDVEIVGRSRGETLRGKHGREEAQVERGLDEVSQADYDALVIPGGGSPAHLRREPRAVEIVREFVKSGKPVAAVCHGPELLVEAGVAAGRELTSWPEVRSELESAGARWVDREVVEDGNLITSRKPEDLQAFSSALEGRLGTKSSGRRTRSGMEASS